MTGVRPRKALTVACTAGIAAFALAACGSDDGGSTGTAASTGAAATSTASADAKPVKVAHFTASLASPFEVASLNASKAEAESLGASVDNFDAANDPQKQLQQCQDAIATQKYQAFIIKSVDGNASVSCAENAIEAGIKVVALDTPIGPDVASVEPQVEGITGSVVSLPTTYGKGLGDLTVDACEGKDPCKVISLFGPPAFSFIANARKELQAVLKANPSIEVVGEATTNFAPDTAQSVTKQLLQKNPDTNVIVDDDDATAVAILQTIEEMGLKDKVTVIGGGGAKEAVELIKTGELFGTTPLLPATEAKTAAAMVIKDARGEDPGKTNIDAVSELSSVGATVTKDNAGEFTAEWTTGG